MKYNFQFLQTGGVPLTNDLMALIEEAYSIFETLGDLAGNLTILKGCETVGSNVAPGIVAIEGKLYYFEGGLTSDTVFIHAEDIQKTFEDQSSKVLIVKKTVKFGNALNTYNWSDFLRIGDLRQIIYNISLKADSAVVNQLIQDVALLKLKTAPIINGGVIWAFGRPANEIPAGWKECLDTRGKTLVGRDPNDATFSVLGNNIGEKTHTLTIAEMPAHKHIQGSESLYNRYGGGIFVGGRNYKAETSQPSYDGQYTSTEGGGAAHNNIQPSRIVNFIEPNFQ